MRKGKRFKIKNKRNILISIIRIVLIIIFIISLYEIIKWIMNNKKDITKNKEIVNEVVNYESENEIKDINFDKLLKRNNEIVGWINIVGTNINYPIVQAKDNEYYLKRDIDKNYSISGSIFMDYNNNKFLDKNTVIYGHNMNSKTMFSDLTKIYKNKLGKDIIIKIYTVDNYLQYKVFSCYVTEPELYSINTNVEESKYEEFNRVIQNKSKTKYEVRLESNDKILTLSTCSVSGNKRIIVHAVELSNNNVD